jgi:VWFA-related protein
VTRVIVLLAVVFGAPAAFRASAQEARTDAPIRIGAVVTDPRGRPILDLKASDFELTSGGVVQPLSGVELRRAGSPAAAASPRTFALFLDEFHMAAGTHTERARAALLRFVDEQVRPGDRVAVMKPLDSQTAIDFMTDRAAVRAAVESFAGRAGDYTPRTDFEAKYIGHAPAAVETARAQIVTAGLRALSVRLGQAAEGRSAIAFVSEGFPGGGRAERERRMPDDQTIARLSNRFNVAIYTLDPAVVNAGDPPTLAARLRKLAADTGGESSFGEDLLSGLQRMTRDLDAYYLLTFQPVQRADGRFQRVEVTARRRDVVVRAPSGFWMPLALPASSIGDVTVAAPARTVRRSSLIHTWTGLTRLADGRLRMRVTWEPSRRAPAARAPAVVLLRAAKAGGAPLFEGKLSAAGGAGGVPQLAEFIVPAGRIEIDLAIVAPDGSTLDKDVRDVDVPDARRLRVTSMNPEIVRTRTVKEFAALSVDPGAAPTPLREFRRADRLLVRSAVFAADGTKMAVSGRLLNRWGQPMRPLATLPLASDAMVQFDLPLAWLAAGDYEIELTSKDGQTETAHRLSLKVTG